MKGNDIRNSQTRLATCTDISSFGASIRVHPRQRELQKKTPKITLELDWEGTVKHTKNKRR